MNLEYQEKCQITFPSDKGTAHTLTLLAHMQGITQPQLLQKICEIYIAEKLAETITKVTPETLNKILNEE